MSAAAGRQDGVPGRRGLAGFLLALGRRLFGAGAFSARTMRGPIRQRARDALARAIEIESGARSAFFLAPAGMMVGISLIAGLGWRGPYPLFAGLAMACLVAVLLVRRTGRPGHVCLVAGFAALGACLAQHELDATRTTTFSGEATVRIEGRVLWRDRDERGRHRYLLAIEKTERPLLSRPPERVQILVSSHHVALPIGSTYAGLVRLRPPSGPAFPGAYDFAFGTHFNGLGAYGFGLGPPAPPNAADLARPPTAAERILRLRLSATERIKETIGGAEGAVAAALITGDRSGIPEDVELWLRSAGLSHVLSISGLHMAIVAGFAMTLVRALLAASTWCALVLPIKKIAAVAALCVASFYLLISGSNVATDRSYIMLSIMLLAVLFDRPALTLRNVAIAAMIVLALTPHALVTASFQMSFAATAALVGAYGAYARARNEDENRSDGIVRRSLVFLLGLSLSSLIAGTATAPYAAYHFQRIAPFGLIANLLALPLFSLWIMPLALISMLLMPLGLDAPFLALMGHGLTLVVAIARAVHTWLPDAPTGRMTLASLLVLSLALLVGCFFASRLRWFAVPIAVIGLCLTSEHSALPDLLVFEDGRELALLDEKGGLVPLRKRPNDFVFSQWQRAFDTSDAEGKDAAKAEGDRLGFTCEPTVAIDDPTKGAQANPSAEPSPEPPALPPNAVTPKKPAPRPLEICRATTRGGLRIVWTNDYDKTGTACDSADIAIVARAIKLDACRSGATLITLRTLRRTGSIAAFASPETSRPLIERSIATAPQEWNRHRLAPWPESWRKPPDAAPSTPAP